MSGVTLIEGAGIFEIRFDKMVDLYGKVGALRV
jgi:hypothetical protein